MKSFSDLNVCRSVREARDMMIVCENEKNFSKMMREMKKDAIACLDQDKRLFDRDKRARLSLN